MCEKRSSLIILSTQLVYTDWNMFHSGDACPSICSRTSNATKQRRQKEWRMEQVVFGLSLRRCQNMIKAQQVFETHSGVCLQPRGWLSWKSGGSVLASKKPTYGCLWNDAQVSQMWCVDSVGLSFRPLPLLSAICPDLKFVTISSSFPHNHRNCNLQEFPDMVITSHPGVWLCNAEAKFSTTARMTATTQTVHNKASVSKPKGNIDDQSLPSAFIFWQSFQNAAPF